MRHQLREPGVKADDLRQRVGDATALGQIEGAAAAPGALAGLGEEQHVNGHGWTALRAGPYAGLMEDANQATSALVDAEPAPPTRIDLRFWLLVVASAGVAGMLLGQGE